MGEQKKASGSRVTQPPNSDTKTSPGLCESGFVLPVCQLLYFIGPKSPSFL